MTREGINQVLGRMWASRARRQARRAGTYQAARNLRKQGVGLGVTLLLLVGRV